MKQVHGWWFPDEEVQLPAVMTAQDRVVDGRLTWQFHKLEAAMRLLPMDRRRTAIDIGAHVGLFSYWMAKYFDVLIAFEPVPQVAMCWVENLVDAPNVRLLPYALGAERGRVALQVDPTRTGGTHVIETPDPAPFVVAERHLLDEMVLTHLDFVKIDVEGYEPAVITGARETLQQHKPVVLVEEFDGALLQHKFAPGATRAALEQLGMVLHVQLGHDYIYTWPAGA